MSDTDEAEAKLRAEWLHKHKAPKDWIILTGSEVSTIRAELEAVQQERDEARAITKEAITGLYNLGDYDLANQLSSKLEGPK